MTGLVPEFSKHFRLGIEFTFQPQGRFPVKEYSDNDYRDNLAESAADYLKARFRHLGYNFNGLHNDDSAVEISTPPMDSWGGIVKFYRRCLREVKPLRLAPLHPDFGDGGGHIHVSWLEHAPDLVAFRDYVRRPYLNWFFNGPEDNYNANNPFLGTHPMTFQQLNRIKNSSARDPWGHKPCLTSNQEAMWLALHPADKGVVGLHRQLPDNKGLGLRFSRGHKTREARYMGAPEGLKALELQVAFVVRYNIWLNKLSTKPSVKFPRINDHRIYTMAEQKGSSKDLVVKDFKALLETLELPVGSYMRRFSDRYDARFQWGGDFLR